MASSPFLKPLSGYRAIVPLAGESIQELALRELGDASLWTLIAWVNGLVSPYIVQSASQVGPGVVLAGTPLKVPAASPEPAASLADLYYTDVLLVAGMPQVTSNGDLQLVAGPANLEQGLRHRLIVDRRELLFHPTYGCYVSELLGRNNTPQDLRLAEFYVRSSLLEDERVRSVASVVATATALSITVVARVIAISGITVALEVAL